MIAALIIVAIIAILIALYAYNNLHKDDAAMRKVWRAGFAEKKAVLKNGTTLNYGEGGNVSNTPVLLIHGQGQAWQDYDRVLPTLVQRFHVFAVDCHGHGKSSHDPKRYNCKLMSEDFGEFIENVIGAPCVITGHSSGGVLTASVAALFPNDVLAAVIEDAPLFCVEPDQMKSRKAIVWYDGFLLHHKYDEEKPDLGFDAYSVKNGILWNLFGGLKEKLADSIEKFERKNPDKPLKIWYVPQSLLKGMYYSRDFDKRFALTFYDGSWFNGTSQEDILSAINCPTTYIKAKTGYIIDSKPQTNFDGIDISDAVLCCANTEADAEKVTKLIKGCRRVTTPTSDHLVHSKYPDIFVNEMNRYADLK